MAEKVVLSGSSLNTFLRCAQQWSFAYVQRIHRPPSLKAALGISAHSALEMDLTQKIESGVDLPREEVVAKFADEFKREASDAEEKPKKKETRPVLLDSGVIAVGYWYDVVAPGVRPVLVEQHGQFSLNGVPYDWTLDLVDKARRIRDWKFVGRKPQHGQEYVLNMVGYAIGYRRLTGGIERGVQLDHIVRTKQPQYVPLKSGPVPDQDIRAFADILYDVTRSIEAGIFMPTGLKSGACSWCGYTQICPAYKRA